jgi:Protein of unknown function (DUF998)
MSRQLLLWCGIASSVLYVAMNMFVPMGWPGYSSASRMVSELSAIDAPTRPIWVPLGLIYTLLVVLFGWGVWRAAGDRRRLRVTGASFVVYGLIGLFWPPMHQREVLAAGGKSLTDTLHIAWTMASVALMLLAMGASAPAFGAAFRRYTMATMVLLVGMGLVTGQSAARVEANLPTPWMGVWERIDIALFLAWIVVLALKLLREPLTGRAAAATDLVPAASGPPGR